VEHMTLIFHSTNKVYMENGGWREESVLKETDTMTTVQQDVVGQRVDSFLHMYADNIVLC
jgi:hypothetical protein